MARFCLHAADKDKEQLRAWEDELRDPKNFLECAAWGACNFLLLQTSA